LIKKEWQISKESDWHLNTQNSEYLELSKKRLSEPTLIWVNQFTKIINDNILLLNLNKIKVNDIGCNVGHFPRNLDSINSQVTYKGIDISKTYIEIARNHFPGLKFYVEDFSNIHLDLNKYKCDISIVSATLEHIENYEIFLENIFKTTSKNILIRTFIGDERKMEYCLKEGASKEYLVRQFLIEDLTNNDFNKNWTFQLLNDSATNSQPKTICTNIIRKQAVLNFIRLD
jgi:2-polyprenyl-3-methyl-5-hydroxy-6-metoxy-1,4-benzoquinol methylase